MYSVVIYGFTFESHQQPVPNSLCVPTYLANRCDLMLVRTAEFPPVWVVAKENLALDLFIHSFTHLSIFYTAYHMQVMEGLEPKSPRVQASSRASDQSTVSQGTPLFTPHGNTNCPNLQVFGLWDLTRVPEGNPLKHRGNMQTPHAQTQSQESDPKTQEVHHHAALFMY